MAWQEAVISAADNLLGGIVGGAFNIASTNRNNQANMAATMETNQAQMELAQYQAHEAERLWHLDNDYNHPLAQMERLKEAGLNPHLVYGNGSVANTSNGPAQGYQAPDLESSKYQAYNTLDLDSLGFKSFMSAAIQSAQLDNLEKQNDLIKYQGDAMAAEARGKQLDNIIKAERSNFARQLATYEVDGLEQTLRQQEYKTINDYYTAQQGQYNYQHLMPLQEREARLRITGLQLSNAYTRAQRDLAAQNTARVIYETENLLPQQSRLTVKQQVMLEKQIYAQVIENGLNALDFKFFRSIGLSPQQANYAVESVKTVLSGGAQIYKVVKGKSNVKGY